MTKVISGSNFQQNHLQARKAAPREIPKEAKEFAEIMETQYANHLLNEMSKTVNKANPTSSSNKIYESMQDHERAKIIAKSEHGLGVKEFILEQLYPTESGQRIINNDNLKEEITSSNLGEKYE